jgi:hypothetical protein
VKVYQITQTCYSFQKRKLGSRKLMVLQLVIGPLQTVMDWSNLNKTFDGGTCENEVFRSDRWLVVL